jgi:hypothetical protein
MPTIHCQSSTGDGTGDGDAGIVHQQVQAARGLHEGPDRIGDETFGGHVARVGQDARGAGLLQHEHRLGQVFTVEVEHADRPAVPGQQAGQRQAEAARGAGDERAL